MIDNDALKKLASIAVDAAVSNGAESADVSARYGNALSAAIRCNAIEVCDARLGGGLSVRAIYRGGTGWFTGDKLTPESAAEAGRSAARLAEAGGARSRFRILARSGAPLPQCARSV